MNIKISLKKEAVGLLKRLMAGEEISTPNLTGDQAAADELIRENFAEIQDDRLKLLKDCY